jgi:hypothetical protein
MKNILEFNMPDDESNFKMAYQGPSYHVVLWNLDQTMRNYLKHGHQFESIDAAIESIRNELHDQMREHYCSFTE